MARPKNIVNEEIEPVNKENLLEINSLTDLEIITNEDLNFKNKEIPKKIVKIEPCYSDLFKAPILFQNTKIIFKILKDKSGNYIMPLGDNPQLFLQTYPSLSRFVVNNKWNEQEINNFSYVVTNIGVELDINNNFDKFIFNWLKTFPELGEEQKPINYKQKFYYINTEQNAIDNKTKYNYKKEAYIEFDKMSKEDKLFYNSYLGKPTINISNEVLDSNIIEYLESNPEKFVTSIKSIDIVRDYGIVGMALEKSLIRREEGYYYYNEIKLGTELKEIIATINKPQNLELKIILREKVLNML